MIDLKYRVDKKELMDDLSISFEEFQETLSEIEVINHMTFAYWPTITAISKLYSKYHQNRNTAIKVLDIGSGHGDHLRVIYHWAKKNDIQLEMTGLDLNPWSEQAASILTTDDMSLKFITKNIFDFKPEEKYDICINSLFTHHLTNSEIIDLLTWMTANTNYGWFINDLHRHHVPYYLIKYLTRVFNFNRLVINDAPLSVARAFKRDDWHDYLINAGISLEKTTISWYPSFRYGVFYGH